MRPDLPGQAAQLHEVELKLTPTLNLSLNVSRLYPRATGREQGAFHAPEVDLQQEDLGGDISHQVLELLARRGAARGPLDLRPQGRTVLPGRWMDETGHTRRMGPRPLARNGSISR